MYHKNKNKNKLSHKNFIYKQSIYFQIQVK
jgi:hypothetical protein